MKSLADRIGRPGFSILRKPELVNLLLILGFGLLFASPNLNSRILWGDDHDFHILRYFGTARALLDGQLIPQLDPAMYGGFGYAPNLFYPPLTAWLVMLLNLVTPTWNLAINLASVITQIFAGLTMYYLVRRVSGNPTAGVISAVAYMGSPYLIANAAMRFGAGELMAMAFAPLMFLGLWKIVHRQSGWLPLGIAAGGLLLSHNLSAVIFAIFALLFLALIVILRKGASATADAGPPANRHSAASAEGAQIAESIPLSSLKQFTLAALIAFGLSAVFLLPFLEAQNAAEYNVFIQGFMTSSTLVRGNAHASVLPWLIPGGRAPFSWLGLPALAAFLLCPMVYRRLSQQQRRFMINALALASLALLLSTRLFPWEYMPAALLVIQFPWRLNLIAALFLSALFGIVLSQAFTGIMRQKKNVIIAEPRPRPKPSWPSIVTGAFLTVVSAALVMTGLAPNRVDAEIVNSNWLNDVRVWNDGSGRADYLPGRILLYSDNNTTNWFGNVGFYLDRTHEPEALTGQMSFRNFAQIGTHMSFEADVVSGGIVELPVFFYPGYRAYVNGVRVTVFESHFGFAAFELPNPGEYISAGGRGFGCTNTCQIEAYYGMSPATRMGAALFATTTLGLAAYGIWDWRNRRVKVVDSTIS